MKSNSSQLESRGYVSPELEAIFGEVPFAELLYWLHNKQPAKRTFAARRLGQSNNAEAIEPLCFALESEKKLYTKLEICEALVAFGKSAVPNLIVRLGKIGDNHYKEVPSELFKKKNYPLPRDVVARVLMRIGQPALSELGEVLHAANLAKISEAIDAIGYICYYGLHNNMLPLLYGCFERHKQNELIRWKVVRAMSAFTQSRDFLEQQLLTEPNKRIVQEIERSLGKSITVNKMNSIIHLIVKFVTGEMSVPDFENELYTNTALEETLRDPSLNWNGTFIDNNLYDYLIVLNYSRPEHRADAVEALKLFLNAKGIDCTPTDKYSRFFDVIHAVQPKYLNVDSLFIEKYILPPSFEGTQAELKQVVKANYAKYFKYQAKPPKWIQNPQWIIRDEIPLFFVGQLPLSNSFLHDDGAVYVFLNPKTGEIETVTQLY